MASWKIYVMVLVPVIGIGLIFKYLVSTNKIKPNKISRLFYFDDESFINSWKETEKKGFMRYTFKNIIFTVAIMCVLGVFSILTKRSMFGYEQSQTFIVALSMGVILGLIHSLIWWSANKDREEQIKEKAMLESDNVNKDN